MIKLFLDSSVTSPEEITKPSENTQRTIRELTGTLGLWSRNELLRFNQSWQREWQALAADCPARMAERAQPVQIARTHGNWMHVSLQLPYDGVALAELSREDQSSFVRFDQHHPLAMNRAILELKDALAAEGKTAQLEEGFETSASNPDEEPGAQRSGRWLSKLFKLFTDIVSIQARHFPRDVAVNEEIQQNAQHVNARDWLHKLNSYVNLRDHVMSRRVRTRR